MLFLVARKRKLSRNSPRRLPKALLARWPVDGERILCAVPTDIDSASDQRGIRPHATPAELQVVTTSGVRISGVAACAVARSNAPGRLFLLSCRHVFGATAPLYPSEPTNLNVLSSDGTVVASTRPIRGVLRPAPAPSFDAQIALATDASAAALVLHGASITGAARAPVDVPTQSMAYICTAMHGAIPVWIRAIRSREILINYAPASLGHAVFDQLIECHCAAGTVPVHGDSGSPLLTKSAGGTLLGMHIAGDSKTGMTYALPAWSLISPDEYLGASSAETWTLV